jgi:hypothetical protein
MRRQLDLQMKSFHSKSGNHGRGITTAHLTRGKRP